MKPINTMRLFGIVLFTFLVNSTLQAVEPIRKAVTLGKIDRFYLKGISELIAVPSVCCDTVGNLYIFDAGNSCIYKIDSQGKLLWKVGGEGDEGGKFRIRGNGERMVLGEDRQLYISDIGNNRIQVLSQEGKFIREVHTTMMPYIFAPDGQGNIFVLDRATGKIYTFDQKGKIIKRLDHLFDSNIVIAKKCYLAIDENCLYVVAADYPFVEVYDLLGNQISSYNYFAKLPNDWQDDYASMLKKPRDFLRVIKPKQVSVDLDKPFPDRHYPLVSDCYFQGGQLSIFGNSNRMLVFQSSKDNADLFYDIPLWANFQKNVFAETIHLNNSGENYLFGNMLKEKPACIYKVSIKRKF